MNLENMTAAELAELKNKTEAALAERRVQLIRENRDAINARLAEEGLTIADLYPQLGARGDGKRRGSSSGSPAKYRQPSTGKTWNGRGRKPEWMKSGDFVPVGGA
jgi:DNA-binding protein H-NS